MQNKGIVRVFAILLALVSLFYLSFSVVTGTYNRKAKEYAAGDKMKEYQYLDSLSGEKVYFGYTLKECREKEINLGLDLKGGMNVTLEVSVADILRALSGYNNSPEFLQALQTATERQKTNSQIDYLDLFVKAFEEINPQGQLASVFSTMELKDKISLRSTNNEVVSVLRSEIDGAISNSFNVLRSRIDRFGVVQPNIQRDNNNVGRILIELPGVKEPERVRKLLQGSANLEFWETFELTEIVNNIMEADRVLAAQKAPVDSVKALPVETPPVEEKAEVAQETSQTPQTPQTEQDSLIAALKKDKESTVDTLKLQEQFKKEHPLLSVLQIPGIETGQFSRGPVVGFAHYKDTASINSYFAQRGVKELMPANLGLRWTVKPINERGDIYQLIAIKTNRDNRAPLSGDAVTDARADFSQTSAYANVSMSMNSEGAKIWARMTKENIGKSIAIALDGYIYSFPTVNTEITGGQSQITGNFTVEEAKDLANTLNSGKMPAPARIVQEDVVGPLLGQQAIQDGLISFIIAFILVLLYMIFYYGFIPGLIADIALFINVFFLMGILASFGAVLTLPGIAGIVLTLGMAVDGNVLIYERVREELIAGKTQKSAIKDGFKNAISAIVDANVTTLLTGIVLMVFGTGPILGFATTLVMGIFTSFFTSVFLTRMMLITYVDRKNAKELTYTTKATETWFQNMKVNFIGKRKVGYIVSATIIAICLVSLFTRNLSYGIDFSGGRNYVVRFDQNVNTEDVRELLEEAFQDENEQASAQVITIGDENQVRISTKYKIGDNSESADNDVISKMYQHLKPMLKEGTSQDEFVSEYIQSSQKVGPTVADDIKTAAVWAIFFSLVIVSLYIFIRFKDFAFSVGTLASLAHDVAIILGVYSLFYSIMPFSMEMDQSFIAAILTYVGYSVNDTVVIFDRIRENIRLYPKRDRESIMNESLNETLSRTFSTSASVMVVMIAIFVFGGETIRGFIFALLIGSILGVYSTLFVAVPVAYDLISKKQKRKAKETTVLEKKK
ncbi:MAG: protein translocase subunit SecDF [Paludibacter sp.]|nr:protein translocase subunit SecDF [Paludibacter sp.]